MKNDFDTRIINFFSKKYIFYNSAGKYVKPIDKDVSYCRLAAYCLASELRACGNHGDD
jgi:hypothetical protein